MTSITDKFERISLPLSERGNLLALSPTKMQRAEQRAEGARTDSASGLTREALAAIYESHQTQLYRYVARRVGHADTARDLTSEVFRRLVQAVAQGAAPTTSVRAWLYRTAHNVVVDHYRRQAIRKYVPLSGLHVDPGPGPALLAEQRIQAEQARTALQSLTEDQQQVVALRFLEGLSLQETAEIVERSIAAVKALQHRGLAAMQRCLSESTAEERSR